MTLETPDIRVPPRIDFRLLSDPRDPPRFLKAARFTEALLRDAMVGRAYEDAFLLPPVLSLHQFNQPGVKGALFEWAAKVALNTPPAIKRRLLEQVISPGRWVGNQQASEAGD